MSKKLSQEALNKPFPLTSVCRADLEGEGYDTTNVTDDDMAELAEKMAEAFLESGYWEAIQVIADEVLKVPHKHNRTPIADLDYKSE